MNNIDVSLVHAPQAALRRLQAHGHGAVNARDLNAVTRLGFVHHFIKRAQVHRVRSLALRDIAGALLALDQLAVVEAAAVVDDDHRLLRAADFALRGLRDAALVELYLRRVLANVALKERCLKVWNDGGGADDHTTEGNELVDVGGVEVAHDVQASEVERPHFDLIHSQSQNI